MGFSIDEYRKSKKNGQSSTTQAAQKTFSLDEYRRQKALQSGSYADGLREKQEAEYNNLVNSFGSIDTSSRSALSDAKNQALRSRGFISNNRSLYANADEMTAGLDDILRNIDKYSKQNGTTKQTTLQTMSDLVAKQAIDRYNAAKNPNAPTQYLSNLTPEQAVEGAEGAYEYRQENKKDAWDYAKDYFSRGHYAGSTESLGDAITPAFTSTGNPNNVDATIKYNLDGYDEDTQATFELVAANSQKNPLTIAENSAEQTDDVKRYTYMTDEEKNHYNRLYGLKSPDEAEAYHNMILSDINQRIANEKYETTYKDKSTLGKTGTMLAQGFQSGLTGIANTGEALLGIDRPKATPVSEYIASDIRNDKGNNAVENIIYDIAQSTGNMAPGMIVSALTGNVIGAAGGWTDAAIEAAKATAGTAGNLVFALSQYGNSWREAIDNGENASTAGLYAIQQGVDESATNFLLGGIDAFGNSAARKFLKGSVKDKFVGALDKVMKSEKGKEIMKVLYDSLADMGGEAAQEYVQYFTQNWTQALLGMKDQKGNPVVANFDMLNDEALYSALLGALNAGVLNARSTVRNVRDAAAGRTVQNTATAEQAEQDEAKPEEAAPETAQQETQTSELTEQNITPEEQKTTAIELATQMNGVSPEEITQNVPNVELPEGTQSVQITDGEGNVTDALQTQAQATADVAAETADVLPETVGEAAVNELHPQTVAEAVQPQTASEVQPQAVQAERTYSPEVQALATEMGISEEAADTILQMERSNESATEAPQTQTTTRTENVTPATAEAATDENNEAVKLSNIKARSSQFPERASKVYNDNYDGGDVVDYDEHMKRAYTAGFNGTPMNDIYDDYYVEHAEAMEAMWRAGSVEHIASTTPAATTAVNAAQIAPDATATATSATPAATNVASAATTPAATATADTAASTASTATQKKGKDINDLRKISQEKKAAKRKAEVKTMSEDYSEDEAKAFVENYDPSITPSEYQDAWDAAVEAGRAHAQFDEIDASIMDKLGATTYAIAYNMGSDESYETAQRYSRSTETESRTESKENKQETKTDVKSGLVRDANFKKANLTSTQAKVLDYIGKAIGSPVRFVEELYDDNGKAVNGTYNNGEILISLDTKDPFMTTFMHESVHRLKAVNPEAYAELRDFVKEATGDDYFSALVEEWGKRYEGDTDYVSEEVVADAMGYVFGDEEGTRRFVESHRELARTLSDIFHDVIRTINNYIKGIGKTGGELTQRQRDVMQPIFERMSEAVDMLDAAINETAGKNGKGKENDKTRYSYAGVNAATADVKTLAEAEKLLAQGEDSETVRQKTGWFKGMDGKWRFELDDSQITFKRELTSLDFDEENENEYYARQALLDMDLTDAQVKDIDKFASMVERDQVDDALYEKLSNELGDTFTTWATILGTKELSRKAMPNHMLLSELIDAPKLFEAYPSLESVPVVFKKLGNATKGSYNEIDGISINKRLKGNADGLKSTLLHEIQHAIQAKEGFSNGASPEYWESQRNADAEKEYDRLRAEDPDLMIQAEVLKIYKPSTPEPEIGEKVSEDWAKYYELRDQMEQTYGDKIFLYVDALENRSKVGQRSSFNLYRNTAGEIEARDVQSRRNLTASERRVTAPNLGDENTVFVEGDAGASNSIVEPFTDEDGNKYESAVLLDTDFFDGISPRNWMRKLKQYVESRAENSPFIMVVQDESGDSQSLQFAKKQDRVEKNGNTHPVLSELYRAKDNISKLAVIHIDEIVEISEENNPYYTSDNSHGWLDKHGWLHRNANVINAKTGDIYNLTFDIAKAADGRIILYATKGKIQKVGNAKVHSLKIRGAKQNSNLADSLTQNNENSNNQKRFSKSVDLDEADMERLENIRKANSHIRYMNDVFDATVTAVTGKSTRTGSAQRAVDFAIKTYSSTADGAELTNTLQTVYDYLSASSKADAQEVYAVVHSVAEDIVNGAQTKNTDMDQQYPGLRKQLRTTRLNVSDTIRKSIPDYNDFRKANMGALKLAKTGGIEVDSFYEELSTQYPELFPAEIANDTDRLLQISEIAGLLKPQMVDGIVYDGGVMTAEEMEVETAALTQKLMNGFFGSMNTVDNTPKYEATIKALKAEHETELTKKQAEVEWYKHAYQEWKANTKSWYSKAYQQWKGNTKDWYSKAYKDWKQRYVERNDINSAKKRIISDVKSLTRMLEHPTDSKHVPDFLRTDLANFLSKIDFSSDYVHPSGDLTQRTLDWQKLQNTLGGILNSQANAIQTGEGTVYMDIDPDIVAKMKELNKAVESGKRLNDMTKDEIKNLRETMIAMKKCIESANKLVTSKKNETVQSRGDATIQQLAKHKNRTNSTNAILRTFDKLFTDDMLDSDARFYTMGKAAYECYKSLREGLNTKIFDIQSVSRYFEQIRKENNVTRADMDDWASGKIINEIQLDSGKKIKLTPAIAMNIYALSKRGQAMSHLLGDGITIAPIKDGGQYIEQGTVQLTKGDLKKISDTLTKEQKAVQDAISANYRTCATWGNQASMTMYGYEKFGEEDYTAPIETDKNFIPVNSKDVIGNYDIIKNYGFTKDTKEGARNPIIARSTFDVYIDHVNKMSNYHAFLAPLSDVQKWLNYRAEGGTSVRTSIQNALGKDANQYILKLMRNINGFKVDDTYFAKPLISLYKGSAVGFNISVAVQQPTSYLRAIAVVPQKYLLKGLSPTKLKVGTFEDIKNYSAIAQWKDWGFFETDVGRSLKSILLGGQTGLQSLNDKQMWLAGKGDEVAWTAMWRACEAWVEDTNKSVEVGSDEYFKKVAEKFDMIIDKTQVVDSPLHRAEIMRSSSELNQIATSFMSEPMKSYNTLYRTLYDVKNPEVNDKTKAETQKAAAAAFTGWITANVLAAAAKSLVTALRDDDKDKEYWDRWNESFIEEALGNLNPLGYIPWVKDIYSILEGYDSSRMDLQIGNDLNYLISRWKKRFSGDSPYTIASDIVYSLRIVSRATGIGFNSLQRDVNAIVDEAISMIGADEVAYQKAKTFKYDIGNSSNLKYYTSMALKAYVNGNKALGDKIVKDMKDAGIDEEKLNTKMKSLMKDNPDMAKQVHEAGGEVGLIAAQAQYSSRVSAEGASKKAEKVDILLDMAGDGDITEDELSTIYEDSWGTENFTDWKQAGGSATDYIEYAIDIPNLKVKGNTTNENKEAVIDYIHGQKISKESAAILWELAGYTAERDFDEWYNK